MAHGGQTCAIAEMREDHAALRCDRAPEARKFFHQIAIGQTVETIALNALCLVAPRNWKHSGDTRHSEVKRRVKAGHLRQIRMALSERFDQFDLARQMIRVIRRDEMQFVNQLWRDRLRL